MSAANTGTPMAESCSARTWRVTVLPVPVAPAMRPCRLHIGRRDLHDGVGMGGPVEHAAPQLDHRSLGRVGLGDAGVEVGGSGVVGHGGGSYDGGRRTARTGPASRSRSVCM